MLAAATQCCLVKDWRPARDTVLRAAATATTGSGRPTVVVASTCADGSTCMQYCSEPVSVSPMPWVTACPWSTTGILIEQMQVGDVLGVEVEFEHEPVRPPRHLVWTVAWPAPIKVQHACHAGAPGVDGSLAYGQGTVRWSPYARRLAHRNVSGVQIPRAGLRTLRSASPIDANWRHPPELRSPSFAPRTLQRRRVGGR